jgi:mono/diheme cytochrome c family protein
VTEIPEHLLKKAAEARARLSGDDSAAPSDDRAPAGDATPAAAPAAPVPAVVAEPEPPAVPEPDTPWVAAAKARKTIPVWVMPVLLFLPIWAIYYVGYLERPPATGGLAVEGAEVYATCAGCHGVGGGGGSGRQLSDGQVTATFPNGITASGYDGLAGQIAWVANGSAGTGQLEGASTYGDPERAGGARQIGAVLGNMAGFGDSLSVEELVAAVFHERSQFGTLDESQVEEELALLEEFVVIREESGDAELAGETVEEISADLDEARAALGISEG